MLRNSVSLQMLSKLLITFGIQWVGWAVASLFKTEKFYDVTGSATFCYLTIISIYNGQKSLGQKIQSGCVLIWAIRLGSFLFTRILKEGRDKRFDRIKEHPGKFFITWTLQGVWVFLTLLPSLIRWQKDEQTSFRNIHLREYIGWSLWLGGFLFETVADYQKWKFRNDYKNRDKFIQTGLWSVSRHPNYFGEILLWFGLFLSASNGMKGFEWLSVFCPVFDALLITKISGVPILEKSALKKWGNNAEYLDYVAQTAVLIPYLW